MPASQHRWPDPEPSGGQSEITAAGSCSPHGFEQEQPDAAVTLGEGKWEITSLCSERMFPKGIMTAVAGGVFRLCGVGSFLLYLLFWFT